MKLAFAQRQNGSLNSVGSEFAECRNLTQTNRNASIGEIRSASRIQLISDVCAVTSIGTEIGRTAGSATKADPTYLPASSALDGSMQTLRKIWSPNRRAHVVTSSAGISSPEFLRNWSVSAQNQKVSGSKVGGDSTEASAPSVAS